VRIVHALAEPMPQSVDGCSNAVWTLSNAQAALGHEVCIVAQSATGPVTAGERGPWLIGWSDLPGLRRLRSWADILHLHSGFSPQLTWVQAVFAGAVPVVASPHGAFAAPVLVRRPVRKRAYTWAVERRRLRASDLLLGVTLAETDEIARYLGRRQPPVTVLAEPIAAVPEPARGPRQANRVIFLGRFDDKHKGLDRLVAVAQHSRAEFHLYGYAQPGRTTALPGRSASNVIVHRPVFGVAKTAVLGQAAAYVQPSRWEAFGCAMVEAAMAGIPLVVSAGCGLAADVVRSGSGIAVDFDQTRAAAAAIDQFLSRDSDDERAEMGRRAADWALRSFSAPQVAGRAVEMYEALLVGAGRRPR
jgi:glycosyltransferase involved in cell wall biosynthesis